MGQEIWYRRFDPGAYRRSHRLPNGNIAQCLQAVVADALLQQRNTGLDLVQLEVFIGLVGAVDGAWPHDNGFHAQLLQERRFGGEGNGFGAWPVSVSANCTSSLCAPCSNGPISSISERSSISRSCCAARIFIRCCDFTRARWRCRRRVSCAGQNAARPGRRCDWDCRRRGCTPG